MKCAKKIYRVVGVTFEGKQEKLKRFYKHFAAGRNYKVQLLPENGNKFDANAVAVAIDIDGSYECVGYISRDENVKLRECLDAIDRCYVDSIGVSNSGDIGLAICVETSTEIKVSDEI